MNLGGQGFLRKARNYLDGIKPKYRNEDFWQSFGEHYYERYANKKPYVIKQETLLVEQLKQMQFNTVLEFGCGFGRMTRVLCEHYTIPRYVAFDISNHQIENAKKYCTGFDVEFMVSSIRDFQTNEKFDLVLAPEILMHIEPKDIEYVIKKMSGYATQYYIQTNQTYVPGQKIRRGTHTFYHDYDSICRKVGLPVTRVIPINETNEIRITSLKEHGETESV